MIDRACNWEDPEELKKCFAKEFKVYKFNFDKCLWIEKKETLGDDVALFVGDNLSIRVVASKFPGCKQNSMYYNHDFDEIDFHDYMLNDFGVYEMETKSISKPCSSHVMTLLEMRFEQWLLKLMVRKSGKTSKKADPKAQALKTAKAAVKSGQTFKRNRRLETTRHQSHSTGQGH
ncbi:hypothetical protein ACLB2K_057549 [Fragaria x ananassa]